MIYTESVTRFSIFRNFNVKKILFFTLYDNICLGTRILSSIARNHGIETHLVIFKDQRTRAILRDSKDSLSYQFYFDGIKYGSCYAAYKSSDREIGHFVELVNQIRPDVICLSTRSFGYALSKKIIGCLKPRFDIPVIAGGWGPYPGTGQVSWILWLRLFWRRRDPYCADQFQVKPRRQWFFRCRKPDL